jgi:hypothetical protein
MSVGEKVIAVLTSLSIAEMCCGVGGSVIFGGSGSALTIGFIGCSAGTLITLIGISLGGISTLT